MIKELIISIIVVLIIFFGNFITEKYTSKCVNDISENLIELRKEISKEKEDLDLEYMKNKIEYINKEWDRMYEILSFYIEHNELEKVETELTTLKAYFEKEEYAEVLSEIDKTVFILNHIRDKNKIYLKNIF